MEIQEEGAVNQSRSGYSQIEPSNKSSLGSGAGMNSVDMVPRTLSPTGSKRRTMSPNVSQNNASAEKSATKLDSSLDRSIDGARRPMLSPSETHKDYQRYKYYSALRTGYAHLGIEQPELEPPSHVIDQELFMFQSPFESPGDKHSSMVIIFSCWKTMIGTAVATLPWTFQQSGLILGLIFSFTSFLISFYTCKLIIDMAGNDPDYSDTLKKFYGKFGYYSGLIAPAILILGAVACFFVTMNQVLYPMLLAIYVWCAGLEESDVNYKLDPSWEWFSSNYTAMLIFVIVTLVCSKKDLRIFMKIGSFGVIFVIMLMVFIIYTGAKTLSNTEFSTGTMAESDATDWLNTDQRTLVLFYGNFPQLLGVLCAGYFLHTCSLSIVRNSVNPEKNTRDVFVGYFMVFVSYAICGSLGYIGYMGTDFAWYYDDHKDSATAGQIDQNCLNMYHFTDASAFVLRLAIFFLLFSTYPLVAYFLYDLILRLFNRGQTPSAQVSFFITIMINVFPLICALYIPKIGTLLAGVSTLSGYLIIYVLPVLVYLKHMRTKITNPLLAEALVMNEFKTKISDDKSPQIAVSDEFIRKQKNLQARQNNLSMFGGGGALEAESQETINEIDESLQKAQWRRYYVQYALHMIIPAYGTFVLIYVMLTIFHVV